MLQTRIKSVRINYALILSVIGVILFSGCNGQKEDGSSDKGLPYIVDFEQCMETERAIKISDIADTVEYIELKTPEDMPITRFISIIPVDNFWIMRTRDGVYKFSNKGEYIKTIGRYGQGPGEYSIIYNIDIDYARKEIAINDSGRLICYDLDGNYLRTEQTGVLFEIGISDSILWVSEMGNHSSKYTAFAMNYQKDTVFSIPCPFYGIEPQDAGTGFHLSTLYKAFYRYNDTLYLKGKEYNDTIFQLTGAQCKPYVAFNMGKYKLPIEYEVWYNYEAAQKNGSRYWGIPTIAEDNHYLFLLAQRYANVDGNKYVENEENYRYIVYDKEQRKGFITKGEGGTRFKDDILGGPVIWPRWVIGDYYMDVIEWETLSKELKTGKYTLTPAFEKQIAEFGYDTNPLVVMCHKKSKANSFLYCNEPIRIEHRQGLFFRL